MTVDSLTVLATVCFFAMASPGPDFIVITRNALSCSLREALATSFGVVCGCLLHATYCIAGLALIISQSIVLFSAVKLAGAAYLIVLGYRGLRSASPSAELGKSACPRDLGAFRAFMEGFLCNALNPKCAVFLLSLFTQFITVDASLAARGTVAAVFVIESLIYWPLLVLLLQGGNMRRFFSRWQQSIDRICGALLITLGIRVALSRS